MSGDKKATLLRPAGWINITDDSGTREYDTIQCCHCGCHTPFVPGSGAKRGFCTLCNAMTCASPECYAHYAFEKKLDDYERGALLELK